MPTEATGFRHSFRSLHVGKVAKHAFWNWHLRVITTGSSSCPVSPWYTIAGAERECPIPIRKSVMQFPNKGRRVARRQTRLVKPASNRVQGIWRRMAV